MSRWAVQPALKTGEYILVDETGKPYQEGGKVVRWCSDLAAQQQANDLAKEDRDDHDQ